MSDKKDKNIDPSTVFFLLDVLRLGAHLDGPPLGMMPGAEDILARKLEPEFKLQDGKLVSITGASLQGPLISLRDGDDPMGRLAFGKAGEATKKTKMTVAELRADPHGALAKANADIAAKRRKAN